MSSSEAYWLNVDLPMKRAVLHYADCRHVETRQETRYKGVGEWKRDGGWISFAAQEHADEYFRQNLQAKGFQSVIGCADCQP